MSEKIDLQHNRTESGWPEARRTFGESGIRLEGFAVRHPILYHGTDVVGAREISKSGTIGELRLSFTPDYTVARSFADAKDGIVVSIQTRDIDPRSLEEAFKTWDSRQEYIKYNESKGLPVDTDKAVYSDDKNIVVHIGPRFGHEPKIIKVEVVEKESNSDRI